MLCRAKTSSVSQVGLDAPTDSVLFSFTGGVSFCSGVSAPEVLDSEPKVTPPSLVYTPSDLTSIRFPKMTRPLSAVDSCRRVEKLPRLEFERGPAAAVST